MRSHNIIGSETSHALAPGIGALRIGQRARQESAWATFGKIAGVAIALTFVLVLVIGHAHAG